jgi:hypothetical protein
VRAAVRDVVDGDYPNHANGWGAEFME